MVIIVKSSLWFILFIVIVAEVVLLGLSLDNPCKYGDYCISDAAVPLFFSGPFVVVVLLGCLLKSPFFISASSILHGAFMSFYSSQLLMVI